MLGSIEGRDKKGRVDTNSQNSNEKQLEPDTAEHRGRSLSKSSDPANQLQETGNVYEFNTERRIEIIDNTEKIMERITFISKNYTDISFIKKASAATLLTFILASIVCLGVTLAITLSLYFIAPIAVCVILVGFLISYLYKQNTNNQQAALLFITDFAGSLLQVNSISSDNQQHILKQLDQLATSKEFYEKVKISRKYFKDICFKEISENQKSILSKQLAEVLNSMFAFIEQDLSDDQKKVFMGIKKQYLAKLTNDVQISKKLLDNAIKSDFFKNKQPEDVSALDKALSSLSSDKYFEILEGFRLGIRDYIQLADKNVS